MLATSHVTANPPGQPGMEFDLRVYVQRPIRENRE
jgi:hypothetical protein